MLPKRRKYGTAIGFVIYAAFFAAATAFFSLYEFPQSPKEQLASAAADPDRRNTGTITMPGGPDGCRQVKFDNATGSLQVAGAAKCSDAGPGANSTEGRMSAIRDAFTKR